jgi:hypothetical protein
VHYDRTDTLKKKPHSTLLDGLQFSITMTDAHLDAAHTVQKEVEALEAEISKRTPFPTSYS